MTGIRLALLGIAAVLLLGLEGTYLFLHSRQAAQPPVEQAAQPAVAQQVPDDPRALAAQLLDERHAVEAAVSAMVGPGRTAMVALLQRYSMTEQGAGQVIDRYLIPEFKAHMPELRERMLDTMVLNLTPDELRSLLGNRHDDARRSADAKEELMRTQMQQAGRVWGEQIGIDVFRKNASAIAALGFNPSATRK